MELLTITTLSFSFHDIPLASNTPGVPNRIDIVSSDCSPVNFIQHKKRKETISIFGLNGTHILLFKICRV